MTDEQTTLGLLRYLSRLHCASNEISPKVEVVDGEHRLAGAFVTVADRGRGPVMAVDDVWPAHNSPRLITSAKLLNNSHRKTICGYSGRCTCVFGGNCHARRACTPVKTLLRMQHASPVI